MWVWVVSLVVPMLPRLTHGPCGPLLQGNDNLDDMARCYPVDKLDSYLHQDSKLVVNTHKRCRGGLVSLLRFVLALEASASPIKRARVGAPCRLCGQHPSSYPGG